MVMAESHKLRFKVVEGEYDFDLLAVQALSPGGTLTVRDASITRLGEGDHFKLQIERTYYFSEYMIYTLKRAPWMVCNL